MENTKLSQEELQSIQQLQEKNRAIVIEFGEIELIKLNLERRAENAKKFLAELREEENTFGKELSDKYGDGTVDLSTGEFVPAPKTEDVPTEEVSAAE
tara:strand:+ start:34 stop:327 length:294 start_codon:yes stop_codon:yes gene_type:complete